MLFADADQDGDVDFADWWFFQRCFTGPNAEGLGIGCEVFDFDLDLDVDLFDFRSFHEILTEGQR